MGSSIDPEEHRRRNGWFHFHLSALPTIYFFLPFPSAWLKWQRKENKLTIATWCWETSRSSSTKQKVSSLSHRGKRRQDLSLDGNITSIFKDVKMQKKSHRPLNLSFQSFSLGSEKNRQISRRINCRNPVLTFENKIYSIWHVTESPVWGWGERIRQPRTPQWKK